MLFMKQMLRFLTLNKFWTGIEEQPTDLFTQRITAGIGLVVLILKMNLSRAPY